MSVWTHIEGDHNSRSVSMKKLLKEVLYYEDVVGSYEKRAFSVRFEQEGEVAAKSISRILKAFRAKDPTALITFTATIKYCESGKHAQISRKKKPKIQS